MFYVYEHVLKIDGRKYIGITRQQPNNRWRYGKGYKGCTYIRRAIEKYGWDAFDHNIITTSETEEEAYELEKYYIKLYKTTEIKNGFNLQSGGKDNKQHSSSIEKLVKQRKGYKFTGKALENLQKHAKDMAKNNKGKARPEYVRQKISDAHKGMTYGEETKQKLREVFSQPVLCVELNKIFPSMTAAAEEFGLSKCTISAVINGRNKTAAGYHWHLA